MPELPDITVYIDALKNRILGRKLNQIKLVNPFFLRTVTPGIDTVTGQQVQDVRRIGKRVAIIMEGRQVVLIHLMIAGRFSWKSPEYRPPRRNTLAALYFPNGTLVVREASSKKRASMQLIAHEDQLKDLFGGALEIMEADYPAFSATLKKQNRTLKRVLTDPRLISGIGNAYSDEILHFAGLSPFLRTHQLSEEQSLTLMKACQTVLDQWVTRLRQETGDRFPRKVTAFRPEMAVHGRFKKPCPTCRTPIQRIRYAERECNYCPTCQTSGRLLADRSLSRLLRDDWPKRWEDLEQA